MIEVYFSWFLSISMWQLFTLRMVASSATFESKSKFLLLWNGSVVCMQLGQVFIRFIWSILIQLMIGAFDMTHYKTVEWKCSMYTIGTSIHTLYLKHFDLVDDWSIWHDTLQDSVHKLSVFDCIGLFYWKLDILAYVNQVLDLFLYHQIK